MLMFVVQVRTKLIFKKEKKKVNVDGYEREYTFMGLSENNS